MKKMNFLRNMPVKALAMTLAFLAMSMAVKTQTSPTGTFDLSTGAWTDGSSAVCNWSDPILTVGDGADIIITGTSTDERRIEVEADAKNVHITLDGVKIEGLFFDQSPVLLNAGAEVTVTLAEGTASSLTGGFFFAGIQVPDGATLVINGSGSLQAIGGLGAAGIGAAYEAKCGEITVNSGNVTAVGGEEMPSVSAFDALLTVAASGATDQSGFIVISWFTNRDAGSFTVELSADGTAFNTLITRSSATDVFDYALAYNPIDIKSDLYFRVIQTDGTDTAESGIVKMVYIDGVGFVAEADIDDGSGVDIDEVYVTKVLTLSDGSGAGEITVSMTILKEFENAFDNNVSLVLTTTGTTHPDISSPWFNISGFELRVGAGFTFPTYGAKLLFEFNTSQNGSELNLCKIISEPFDGYEIDGMYTMSLLGYTNDEINASYDDNTWTFSATLPEPGRYVFPMLGAIATSPPAEEVYEKPKPPTEWQPTSELAKIVYAAGFAYDPDNKMMYARMDASQRELGFCYFYDEMIPLISSNISCEPIYFYYDNKEWLIEIWKGQYGIELGAEIGVYSRPANGDLVIDRIEGNYKAVVAEIIRQIGQQFPSIPGSVMNVLTDLTTQVTNNIGVREFEGLLQAAFNTLKNLEKADLLNITPAAFARDAVGAALFGLRSKLYDSAAASLDNTAQDERLRMQFRLLELKQGNAVNELFSRGPEKHWWLTGFKWGMYTGSPHDKFEKK